MFNFKSNIYKYISHAKPIGITYHACSTLKRPVTMEVCKGKFKSKLQCSNLQVQTPVFYPLLTLRPAKFTWQKLICIVCGYQQHFHFPEQRFEWIRKRLARLSLSRPTIFPHNTRNQKTKIKESSWQCVCKRKKKKWVLTVMCYYCWIIKKL